MKTKLIILFLFFCVNFIKSQDLLTGEIISNVYFLKYDAKKASGFLIKYNGRSYLVTAKHFVDSLNSVPNSNGSKLKIEVFQDSKWNIFPGTVFFDENNDIDIACIRQNYIYLDTMTFGITMEGLSYGEEGYFFGFPFGQGIPFNDGLKNSALLPFVKKALLSAFSFDKGIDKLFLDAMNNPGFSGGPIVFKNRNKKAPQKWNIVGVVSSYQNQNIEIKTKCDTLKIPLNSGILIGYGINHAMEIIKKNQNSP